MDKFVPTHNLLSERLVGETNYGLHIRGKSNLETVSRKMVLNKSADLILSKGVDMKKFKKPALEIKEIRLKWSSKMKSLQKKGYDEQTFKNLHKEKMKLNSFK